MTLNYERLSRPERGAARKLAKKLLRTVPAVEDPVEPRSIRGALITAFMRPENVTGALVYTDGRGNWWGDVELNKGGKCLSIGTSEKSPAQSREDALECVKHLIAHIKATREHPLVQQFREQGFDPERIELLRVQHEQFGTRWVLLLDDNEISVGAKAFAETVERKFEGVVDKLEQAREVILQTAPQFATHSEFLQLADDNDEQRAAILLLHYAAAFLLSIGIINVDQDTTEANFCSLNSETISQPPTVH